MSERNIVQAGILVYVVFSAKSKRTGGPLGHTFTEIYCTVNSIQVLSLGTIRFLYERFLRIIRYIEESMFYL